MPSRHLLRIASRMKFILSRVIQHELDDPRLGFVTILSVRPTEDYKEAKVSFSVLGTPGERSKSLHALRDARGFLQKRLAANLRLRNTPQLRFELEEPDDPVARVEGLLRQAREEEAPPPSEES